MKVTICNSNGSKVVTEADLPHLLADDSQMIWVDMIGPTEAEIQVMRDVFHFHPLAIEDTRNQRQRPKVDEYTDYLFIILNTPIHVMDKLLFQEFDVFIGKNYLVSIHQAEDMTVSETQSRIERADLDSHLYPSYLLYMLIDTIVDAYFPILDTLEESIDKLADMVLTDPSPQSLTQLFELKQLLIDLWRAVWPQRDILNSLLHHKLAFVNHEALQPYLRDVSDHLLWIADMINTFRDTLTSVIDLYMSATSNRLNKVVNRLTVYTVVIGLSGVMTGFYGMNFEHTWPPFSSPWGVPFVLGLMTLIVSSLLFILRRLGWY